LCLRKGQTLTQLRWSIRDDKRCETKHFHHVDMATLPCMSVSNTLARVLA
jgi:hypothetical protein